MNPTPDAHPWIPRLLDPYQPLMTYAEVAEALRATPRSVQRWAREGRLTRAGRGVVTRDSVSDYLRSVAGGSTREARRPKTGPVPRVLGEDRPLPATMKARGAEKLGAWLLTQLPAGFRASDLLHLPDPRLAQVLAHLAGWEGELHHVQVGCVLRDLRDVPLGGRVLRCERGRVPGPWFVATSPGA